MKPTHITPHNTFLLFVPENCSLSLLLKKYISEISPFKKSSFKNYFIHLKFPFVYKIIPTTSIKMKINTSPLIIFESISNNILYASTVDFACSCKGTRNKKKKKDILHSVGSKYKMDRFII